MKYTYQNVSHQVTCLNEICISYLEQNLYNQPTGRKLTNNYHLKSYYNLAGLSYMIWDGYIQFLQPKIKFTRQLPVHSTSNYILTRSVL